MRCQIIYCCLAVCLVTASGTGSLNNNDILSRIKRSTERDPYVFNLFEVLLTTLETKLRRVENMDRTLEHLVRRLDSVENKITITANSTNQVVHLLSLRLGTSCLYPTSPSNLPSENNFKRSAEVPKSFPSISLSRRRHILDGNTSSPKVVVGDDFDVLEQNLGSRIDEVANNIARIDSKLTTLHKQFDSNSLNGQNDELVASASENYRIGARIQALEKANPEIETMKQYLDDFGESVNGLDHRIQYRMDAMEKHLNGLSDSVKNILLAVIDDQDDAVIAYSNTTRTPRTKIDSLVAKISPINEVSEKIDEVWDVVVGTKTSVDVLVPKSDALLSTSQRQERAISNIQSDLTEKVNTIIHNLDEVEKELKKMPKTMIKKPSNQKEEINPVALLHRTTGASQRKEASATTLIEEESDLTVQDQETGLADSVSNDTFDTSDRAGFSLIAPKPSSLQTSSKKSSKISVVTPPADEDHKGYSCSDLYNRGILKSGTYHLKIRGTTYWFLQVYCEMEKSGGGWTVIQRRDDFGEPRESFNRNWTDYKLGFGRHDREFWLGNENMYLLTNTEDHVLRVELEDFNGNKRYAEYSTFRVHSEQALYNLEIGGYSGNAGDSLNDPWYGSSLSPFSTYDRDNDRSSLNCAAMLKGGWWWRSCGRGLNGLYLTNPNDFTARQGIVWFRWRGWDYTLKKSLLMIKPKRHHKPQQSPST